MRSATGIITTQMIQKDAEYYYEGCFGGKTGFTSDALNTLVSYAKKDGRTLICVELHVNGKDKAYSESHAMLDYAFENFQNVTVPANGSTVSPVPTHRNGQLRRAFSSSYGGDG